ncbi:hypothetical protein GCM10010413_36540 [Promicromonospora sukumoe]|uniref:Uncharacterized protein n=1 Tax=Promicromonospora sukumoe TaxID=88382 RepID=A0A7W3PDD0_9MICO|nr:hypothetical protein [Promicromonospora sukumoe]MBA8807596.1 hypothetical protein [Promicromonospora sukumoe]
MQFDEANFIQTDLETLLELFGKKYHYDTPAAAAHQNISEHLWPHLKALEYTTERLLAIGEDSDVLAGVPPDARELTESIDDYEVGDVLIADSPRADQWPHPDLQLRLAKEAELENASLVLANLPMTDTRALTRATKTDLAMVHHGLILDALAWLRPGGLLVVTAHRQLLEGSDAQPRRSIARHADLVAAVRLPSSALRQAPLQDSPVDLLLLRRREPGHPPAGLDFIGRSPVHVHDAPDMLINDCYAIAPWAVLGNIVPDPVEPDMTTVAPVGGDFRRALAQALGAHSDIAIDDGLYAQERTTRASKAHPAPVQDTSRAARANPDGPAL